VSSIKSVPNLISYLQEFFWNFSQFLAIYFELFSSRSKFNSEIADMRGPPVSRRFPRRAYLSARCCRMAVTRPCRATLLARLKGAVGTTRRASRQPSQPSLAPPARQPRPSHHRPPHASPLVLSPRQRASRPPRSEAADARVRRRAASPLTHRRRAAPPSPRR
jgi:hypothetical protein